MGDTGFLLENDEIRIESIFDPKTQVYSLMPGLPIETQQVSPTIIEAVIDSGVLREHPQLKASLIDEKDFTGEGPGDRIGHGTMATLVLLRFSRQGGLCLPRRLAVGIISIKVASKNMPPMRSNVIAALEYAADCGAKVSNLSLGFTGGRRENKRLCEMIASLRKKKGMMVVAAAGNFGPSVKVYPASCDHVLSVGAVSETGHIEPYSGQADVYAPGTARVVPPSTYYAIEGMSLVNKEETRGEASEHFLLSLKYGENASGLAVIEMHKGLNDDALRRLQHARELEPENSLVQRLIGAALLRLGRYEEALTHCDRAISLGDDTVHSHFNRGMALWHLRRNSEAVLEFEAVGKADTDYPGISETIRNAAESSAHPT
jgi:hypothetical protein